MPQLFRWSLALLLLLNVQGLTAGILTISNAETKATKSWTTEQLLASKSLQKLRIPLLNYPETSLTIKAIPFRELLSGLVNPDTHVLRFRCADGFSGLLPVSHLWSTSTTAAKAYLAIEDPKSPWPKLPKSGTAGLQSAGPFYLVWEQPENSQIPPEFWPYQLLSFETVDNLQSIWPDIFPAARFKSDHPIQRGFKVYQKRCMACHSINGQGTANLGPDLNIPMNPTEYFKEDALRQFIRNPETVRSWPEMKMRWVQQQSWSRQDIDDLISYLEHMITRRK